VTFGQELPPINTFSSEDYSGHNQNWAISQGDNKHLYFANNAGLLEYNGSKWELHQTPNTPNMRSVNCVGNKIFTGGFMDFGYWTENDFGNLIYNSIPEKLNLEIKENEEFWSIASIEDWVLFQSQLRIYLINLKSNESKVINSSDIITNMFKHDGSIYFHKQGKGLYLIKNGIEKLVSDSKIIKENKVLSGFKINNELLYLIEKKGLYKFINGKATPWGNDIKELNYSYFSGIQLKDKSIVLGTISNGIIHLNTNGTIRNKFNRNSGLSNNTVLSLFEDTQNNIWIGLDNGINNINISSKFKIYIDKGGALGTVYSAINYQGNLYLGTNQGLFYKNHSSSNGFKLIKGTKGQVWTLDIIESTLFCGHDKGTLIIEKNKLKQVIDNQLGTWNFKSIPGEKHQILQGGYNGLSVIENVDGVWRFKNKIDGFDVSSRFFTFKEDQLYVNHEFKGFYKLKINNSYNKVDELQLIEVPEDYYGTNVLVFNDDLLYTSSQGIFKQTNTREFKKDSIFSNLFKGFDKLTTMLNVRNEENKFWRFADDNLIFISTSAVSNLPSIEKIPLTPSVRNVVTGFENTTRIGTDNYLIGTSDGYIIYNSEKDSGPTGLTINLEQVSANVIDGENIPLNKNTEIDLKTNQNNLHFSYSIPHYDKMTKNRYQYKLEGLSPNWSNWSIKAEQAFENLPFGSYIFKVRGKVGSISTANVIEYKFNIARPYYLSNISIFLYALCVVVIFLLVRGYYKRRYRKQQIKFLEKTERDIELKELENKQEIMKLRNDKLRVDIESKNRELANSTMNLINKNEFLNEIRNELLKQGKENSIDKVVKIIDKNINNKDDWKLFQEAFNNVDKDFVKKVKEKHPSLTPNDLRLCAYLRLNLSSKEIAPLLNISSKSVEVKRYRLRKKMNLEHENSLTDYILGI
jgi:DNA-binding CsgD family transcriptional regulator